MNLTPTQQAAADPNAERLVIVRVEDQINPTLAGRTGARYESPPQPAEQACALVHLLLGCPAGPLDGQTRWRCPIAGGLRTVTLDTAVLAADDALSARPAGGMTSLTAR
jgi:hypothetical protein